MSQHESREAKYWTTVWEHRHQRVSTSDGNTVSRPDQTSQTSLRLLIRSTAPPLPLDEPHYPQIVSEIPKCSRFFCLVSPDTRHSRKSRYESQLLKEAQEETTAYRQWPPAGLWWWRCQRCWGPGSCSIPCLSAQRRWWWGPQSETRTAGWRAEAVVRRRASSVGAQKKKKKLENHHRLSTLIQGHTTWGHFCLSFTWLPSRCQNMAGWGFPVASHWKVTVLPTPTTWFLGLTTKAGGTGGQPQGRVSQQKKKHPRGYLLSEL